MKIELDQEAMKSLVSEAIFNSFSAEQRETMLKSALAYLMTPSESSSYGRQRTSPIQDAFNHALSNVANKVAYEMLDKDTTIQDHVKGLVSEAVSKMANDNREDVVRKIADAITSGLTGSKSY